MLNMPSNYLPGYNCWSAFFLASSLKSLYPIESSETTIVALEHWGGGGDY